ncbi:hypothetical protein SAMN05518672_102658 [Chitinophaga sp. CF118]|nr:hypothetical protein SAMN05518672_102658 [Chitinophaga sp. CF118]
MQIMLLIINKLACEIFELFYRKNASYAIAGMR